METTIRSSHDEERVGGGLVDIANVVGLPTTGIVSAGGSPSDPVEDTESHEEEKAFVDPISEDDGISPDDAPEVVLNDMAEEARTITLWVPMDS